MAADDDQVRARLAALEAEVAASSAADRQRKEEAKQRILARRAAATAESDSLRRRQAELVTRRARPTDEVTDAPDERDRGGDLDRALVLARKAGDVKAELQRPTKAGEKSWLISAGLSFFFGPLGWLYAGSLRETIPAAALYVIIAGIVSKIIPMFLLMPVMMVVLPLSGIAGLVYAMGYNRKGKRIKLFGEDSATDGRVGGLLGRGKRE